MPQLENEIILHWNEKSPNVVALFGFGIKNDFPVLIMEEMKCNLSTYMDSPSFTSKSLVERLSLLFPLALTLSNFHRRSSPVIHGDLKPKNILVSHDEKTWKICDFGLAFVGNMYDFRGTRSHMAPECFTTFSVSKKSDVFAFGIILWEIATGNHAWKGFNEKEVYDNTVVKKLRPYDVVRSSILPRLLDLIASCCEQDEEERVNFGEIVEFLHSLIFELGGTLPEYDHKYYSEHELLRTGPISTSDQSFAPISSTASTSTGSTRMQTTGSVTSTTKPQSLTPAPWWPAQNPKKCPTCKQTIPAGSASETLTTSSEAITAIQENEKDEGSFSGLLKYFFF